MLTALRGKDLLPCLGMEGGFIIFKVMSLHVKRNNGGKLEIKCVMLRMKTIISQKKNDEKGFLSFSHLSERKIMVSTINPLGNPKSWTFTDRPPFESLHKYIDIAAESQISCQLVLWSTALICSKKLQLCAIILKLNDNMGMERNKCCAQRTFLKWKETF